MGRGKGPKGTGLRKVLEKTEAEAVVPAAGVAPAPARCTEVPRSVEPRTAPEHTPAASFVDTHGRRSFGALVLVHAPFPNIPGHIHDTLSRGSLRIHPDRRCPAQWAFIAVAIGTIPSPFPRIFALWISPCRSLLPFPLGGKTNGGYGLGTEPAAKGHSFVPGHGLARTIGFRS